MRRAGLDNPVLPALLLCLAFASLYAFLAHFLFGSTWQQMARYWIAAVVGFALAAGIAVALGSEVGRIGAAPIAAGSVGAWLALLAVRWKQ